MNMQTDRQAAATALGAAMNSQFFEACCHPARIGIIRHLIEVGASDIAGIAEGFSQDRSVISRHLKQLDQAGVLLAKRDGRRVVYDVNGPAILTRLSALHAAISALSAICCPPSEKDQSP